MDWEKMVNKCDVCKNEITKKCYNFHRGGYSICFYYDSNFNNEDDIFLVCDDCKTNIDFNLVLPFDTRHPNSFAFEIPDYIPKEQLRYYFKTFVRKHLKNGK